MPVVGAAAIELSPTFGALWRVVSSTGHRPQYLPPGSQRWLGAELRRIAARLRDECGTQVVLSGGAAGADLLWAEAAVGAGLRLRMYLPCWDQPERWPSRSPWRERWNASLAVAEEVVVFGERYRRSQLFARNARLVSDADAVLGICDPHRGSGGTLATMRDAWDQSKPLLRCDVRGRRTTVAAHRP